MDKIIYLGSLYVIYKDLFTTKQQHYFEDYYYNNLSLSEIAENELVSRNAVHSQLKIVEERLEELENTLNFYKKKEKVLKLLKENNISTKVVDKIEEVL